MIDEKNKTPETNALVIKLFDIFSSGGAEPRKRMLILGVFDGFYYGLYGSIL